MIINCLSEEFTLKISRNLVYEMAALLDSYSTSKYSKTEVLRLKESQYQHLKIFVSQQ